MNPKGQSKLSRQNRNYSNQEVHSESLYLSAPPWHSFDCYSKIKSFQLHHNRVLSIILHDITTRSPIPKLVLFVDAENHSASPVHHLLKRRGTEVAMADEDVISTLEVKIKNKIAPGQKLSLLIFDKSFQMKEILN